MNPVDLNVAPAPEIIELLDDAFVIIEGLRLGTDWEISPSIKMVMLGWSQRAEAAIRKAKGETK